ncbi:MAG: hypothetical protein MUP53_05935, partial [Bacteroidales bacterium]|nr:hypothetical protein [Bacteroidales bacterium]
RSIRCPQGGSKQGDYHARYRQNQFCLHVFNSSLSKDQNSSSSYGIMSGNPTLLIKKPSVA